MEAAEIETWHGIKLSSLTRKLAEKYCKEHDVTPEQFLNKAFEAFFREDLKQIEQETIDALPNEQLTIQVPTAIMNFLRASDKMYELSPEKWVEITVVENVEAELQTCEGPFGEFWDLIDRFKLEPVFKAYGILTSPRPYKP